MSKLTNRSKLTLRKIKAQYGQYVDNTLPLNTPVQPNLQSAYNANVLKASSNPGVVQVQNSTVAEEQGSSFLDALPVIGSIGQIIGGIAGIFEGNKKQRLQDIYQNAYEKDIREKREKSRTNNFYMTPYTVGRTDDLTAKKGLKVKQPVYQLGGETDLNSFMEFYNQQEQSKQKHLMWLNSLYQDKNEQMIADTKRTKNQAFGDIGGGLLGLAGAIFQEGGDVETQEIPDNENLYSSDFNLDLNQIEEQVTNTLKAESPGESMLDNSNLMKWLFEEEPLQTHTVSDIYDQQYYNVKYVGEVPQKGDIATTHDNPGNIKYGKFAEKYGAVPGRQAKDGGVFAKFPSVEAGLQAQKDLLTSGSYANLSVSDAMKRWSNSGYGADLYPEIANKRMKDLNAQELNELILRQTKRESPTIYKKIYNK